jgi:hypothetical protein
MRRLIAFALLLFAPVVVEGCHSDSVTNPAESAVGTFTLASVDGGPLPMLIIGGEPKLEVLSDELTFTPTGTFTQNTTFRFTEAGVPSVEAHAELGTFTLTGTQLTIHFTSDNSTTNATLSGDRITVTGQGHALVYVRH